MKLMNSGVGVLGGMFLSLLLKCKKGLFVAKRFYRTTLTKIKRRFDYG